MSDVQREINFLLLRFSIRRRQEKEVNEMKEIPAVDRHVETRDEWTKITAFTDLLF